MRIVLIIALLALISTTALAQTKEDWSKITTGTCTQPTQCLVNSAYNSQYDNQPDRYWSETVNANKPKCIGNGQYLSDHYCESGVWASRTKTLALHLLTIAGQQSGPYVLTCDHYTRQFRNTAGTNAYGAISTYLGTTCWQPGNKVVEPCINNVCTLTTTTGVLWGTTLNSDIQGTKSFLKALNINPTACNNAVNQDNDFDTCGTNLWYNHNTQTIISSQPAIPSITNEAKQLLSSNFNIIRNSLSSNPDYAFFQQPDYSTIFYASTPTNSAFSFKQPPITTSRIEYAGWTYSNLPQGACSVITAYDNKASCTGNIIASSVTGTDTRRNIVADWHYVNAPRSP